MLACISLLIKLACVQIDALYNIFSLWKVRVKFAPIVHNTLKLNTVNYLINN